MKDFEYDLGILGGGAAGLTAAAGGAQFGAKTILIEKTGRLGGECLHTGCVPSKTLIRTAGVWNLIKRSGEFGLPEMTMPPVDLGAVMDRVQRVIDTIQVHDSPERFCGLGAEVRFGDPRFVDGHTVEVDGKRVSAGKWIIATGSHPALPPVEGLRNVGYWTNETVFHQRTLPRRLIVLGGGPIGLEMAQAFARLGSKVVVVEFMDRVMGPEDPDIAGIIHGKLVAEGVEIHTSTKALKAESVNGTIRLGIAGTQDKGPGRFIEADALLVATGRVPNTDTLNLEAAGVEYSPRGIAADARMRTNVKHIYACGDVNGRLPFTHVAGYEAGVALTNAVLRLPRKVDYDRVGWCTYTDPEVASIGFNEKRAGEAGIAYRLYEEQFAGNDRAQADGEPLGKIKLLVSEKGKFLGCQIIGAHAGDLIHEWVIALSGGVKLSTMAGAVHVYPTLSEISKRAAGDIFSEKIFSKKTKDILKLLFNLKGRACRP